MEAITPNQIKLLQEPKSLTDKQLRVNLLTADFRGAVYKELCLEELISRRVKEALSNQTSGATNG